MLVRLLYASRAVDTSPAAIEAILTQSRQHNPGSGITGVLCYGGGVFLQAIEGGRSTVSELYGHIQRTRATRTWCCCTTKKSPSAVLAAGPWARSTCPRSTTPSC